jgi:hypothetical protein
VKVIVYNFKKQSLFKLDFMHEKQKNDENIKELSQLTGRFLYNKDKLIALINELNRKVYANSQNENAEYFSYSVEFINDGKRKSYSVSDGQEIQKEIENINGGYLFLINQIDQNLDNGIRWQLVVINGAMFK